MHTYAWIYELTRSDGLCETDTHVDKSRVQYTHINRNKYCTHTYIFKDGLQLYAYINKHSYTSAYDQNS